MCIRDSRYSVLFPGVTVESGAVVRNCVIFKECVIRRGAQLSYIIADKDVEVLEGRTLMGHATYPIVQGLPGAGGAVTRS